MANPQQCNGCLFGCGTPQTIGCICLPLAPEHRPARQVVPCPHRRAVAGRPTSSASAAVLVTAWLTHRSVSVISDSGNRRSR
jgi:hypothetical protein